MGLVQPMPILLFIALRRPERRAGKSDERRGSKEG